MNMLKLSKTQVSPDADKIKRLKLWNCSRPTWSLQSSGNGGKTWVQPADMLHRLIRGIATALHKLLALGWFVRRPRTFGAHAAALTSEGELILVKLWYAPHWRLPVGD